MTSKASKLVSRSDRNAALKQVISEVFEADNFKVMKELVHKLANLACDGDLGAANILFDRYAGKPVQAVELDGEIKQKVQLVQSAEELKKQLRGNIIDPAEDIVDAVINETTQRLQ